jgi:polyhydroxybutyrate depolymerase
MILVAPNGTIGIINKRFWKATEACCDFLNTPFLDDVAYVNSLIDEVQNHYNVDPKRIYLMGHSNGAFFANKMACVHSNRIAAIVSLAGAIDYDQSLCNPTSKLSVLTIHGTNDTLVNYNGGSIIGAPYPSAQDTVTFWAKKNGCAV